MKNERIDLERTLALSTAHIPVGNPDFGGARHVRHEYGFIVFVMKYRTLPQNITLTAFFLRSGERYVSRPHTNQTRR